MDNKKAIAILVVGVGFLVYPIAALIPDIRILGSISLPHVLVLFFWYLPGALSVISLVLSATIVMKSKSAVIKIVGLGFSLLALWPLYTFSSLYWF